MTRSAWLIAGTVAVATIAATLFVGFRTVAGAALVILVPGSVAALAIMRGRPASLFALALSILVGFSLAVIGGMLLSATPLGLTGLAILVVIAAGLVIAGLRHVVIQPASSATASRALPPRGAVAPLLLAGTLTVIAIIGAVRLSEARPEQPLWQLWLMPDGAEVRIGTAVVAGPPGVAKLELFGDGALLQRWEEVRLAAGQSWSPPAGEIDIPNTTRIVELVLSDETGTVVRRVGADLGPSS